MKNLNLLELFQDEKLEIEQGVDDNEEKIQRIMNMCDVDGDEHISFQEFVQAAIDHSALINKPNIESIFEMLDINGDGDIDQEELRENFKVTTADDE